MIKTKNYMDKMAADNRENNTIVNKVPELDSFKSVFARSVAINSQKALVRTQTSDDIERIQSPASTDCEVIRLRQECQNLVEENRRLNSGRRGRLLGCDVQLPVENFVLQSQNDTLRWQLEQTESSMDMYRAVMEQMVSFLERTHKSLDLLTERLEQRNTSKQTHKPADPSGVPRSKSVLHVSGGARAGVLRSRSVHQVYDTSENTWRKSVPLEPPSPDEIPPDKLSREAFRLLRTAQSLLEATSHEKAQDEPKTDEEFLKQLAKEFPAHKEPAKISLALNRKLSVKRLQKREEDEYCFMSPIKESKGRRNSIAMGNVYCLMRGNSSKPRPGSETGFLEKSGRGSLRNHQESTPFDNEVNSRRMLTDESMKCQKSFSTNMEYINKPKNMGDPKRDAEPLSIFTSSPYSARKKFDKDKMISSGVTGSVSSAEDESGFSSMSSFQEVGVPVYEKPDGIYHASVFHDPDFPDIKNGTVNDAYTIDEVCDDLAAHRDVGVPVFVEDRPVVHRRWSSTPVDTSRKEPLPVLWV